MFKKTYLVQLSHTTNRKASQHKGEKNKLKELNQNLHATSWQSGHAIDIRKEFENTSQI
jgi:hypothetical protein